MLKNRRPVRVEESGAVRLAVFGAVVVAAVGIGWFRGVDVVTVVAFTFLVAGHRWSWRHRHGPRRVTQAIVGLAMGAACCVLVADVLLGVWDDSFPQGTFLLMLMAITGFDIRTRANCYSTLILALVGVYTVAAVAYGVEMMAIMVIFAACVLATLAAAYRADAESAAGRHGDGAAVIQTGETATIARAAGPPNPRKGGAQATFTLTGPRHPRRAASAGAYGLAATAVVLGGVVAFIVIPPYEGNLPVYPISTDLVASASFNGQVLAPLVSLISAGQTGSLHSSYYGFSPELKLGAYGPLDDTVVMRVRSTGWSYWRMQTYDTYTGQSWLTSAGYPYELERNADGSVEPAVYPAGVVTSPDATTIRQTFTLIQGGSNLIAAAYRPLKLYFPASGVWQRAGAGDLLADQPLPAGTTYAVISRLPDADATLLRGARGQDPWEVRTADLGLPPLSGAVVQAASVAVRGASTRYDRVMRIIAYLQAHAHYDINAPALAPGQEAVAALLQTQRGYCEQFATALTVLARANGIPARLVTGFAVGTYDPFARIYTVRASDAHAWTEIYFPTYGWAPFDATPSFGAEPQPHAAGGWVLGGLLETAPRPDLTGLVRGGAAVAGGSGAMVGAILAAASHGGNIVAWLGAVTLAILVAMMLVLWRVPTTRRWFLFAGARPESPERRRRDVVAAYLRAERVLRGRGYPPRDAGATPRRHARRLQALGAVEPAFHSLAALAMAAAYAADAVTVDDVAAAQRLRDEILRT